MAQHVGNLIYRFLYQQTLTILPVCFLLFLPALEPAIGGILDGDCCPPSTGLPVMLGRENEFEPLNLRD